MRRWLEHPLTRGLDIDDPRTTALRREVLRRKPFLRRLYDEWYATLLEAVPPGRGRVLELGSGPGFLASRIPELVTSEVFFCPWVAAVVDAHDLPFEAGSLRALVMTNVLHHVPRVGRFLSEAARVVRPGGVVAMIEPWNTPISRWIYRKQHHEPFLPDADQWDLTPGGPLSAANGAIPWILFARDRARFEAEHPAWSIRRIEPIMPFRYLLSGGVGYRAFVPAATYGLWRAVERALGPLGRKAAMFAFIVLERKPGAP
jgi:SAM-dependent methyltransferase